MNTLHPGLNSTGPAHPNAVAFPPIDPAEESTSSVTPEPTVPTEGQSVAEAPEPPPQDFQLGRIITTAHLDELGFPETHDPTVEPTIPPDFIHRPLKVGNTLQCKVVCQSTTGKGAEPQYLLYIENQDGEPDLFLLSARKRKKARNAYYLISRSQHDLRSSDENIVGKVRANFLGTEYIVYDHGRNPHKPLDSVDSTTPVREELCAVLYEPNILGFKGPRKMTLILPALKRDGSRQHHRPGKEDISLVETYRSTCSPSLLVLHNKVPQWNEESHSYVLNFNGRVVLASVKNFQIVSANSLDYIVLQCGRVSGNTFTLDFQYPMTPLQAFGIALCSIDDKIACQ
ncbi:hypothetical protein IWQ62_006700 [Dispira parvispora]|uniref:Tubby C-terminal domain-containing protein n=1 Tax=Dispira parvispora TaxID=1520584 RepID=A0A9W8DZU5_9FUNG|nr:hypothetical protein IWQ62_006700 [Dispira parvispora]